MNTHMPVLQLNEVGLQNTINTAKWFKQFFNSMHIPQMVIKNEHWVTKKQDNLTRPLHTLTYRHPPISAILIKYKKWSNVFEMRAKICRQGMQTH